MSSVRATLVTLAVACAVAAGIATAGWAVQAATLPPPTRADDVAARAVAWFLRYRLVDARLRVGGGPPQRTRCLQGWLPVLAGGRPDRGTVLALPGSRAVIQAHPRLRVVGVPHGEPRGLALVQLEAAGCSRVDGPRLAALVQSRRLDVDRAFAYGYPALALRVPTRRTRLTIFVTPRTFKPFAVEVTSRRFDARGRIRLTRLTPPVLHAVLAEARL